MESKAELRSRLIATRRAMPAEHRLHADAAIGQRLLAWCRQHRNSARCVIGVYWPIQGEPDLRLCYASLVKEGVQLALPLVAERDAPLQFAPWQPGDPLMKDACGVPVPAHAHALLDPDVILAPCVGFNAAGFRIGYGAGYYDRTFAGRPGVHKLGIAYESALTFFTPAAHDLPLDVILTEAGARVPSG